MKKITAVLLTATVIFSQLITLLGCKNTDNTPLISDDTTNQTTQIPSVQPQQPMYNPSKDPNDYDTPIVSASEFKITCVSYVFAGKTHFIDAFESDSGGYALILPASIGLENIALHFNIPKTMKLAAESKKLTNGISFFDFSKDNSITLTYVDTTEKINEKREFRVYTTDTPIMYLDVDENLGTIDAMHADMQKETHCFGVAYIDSMENSNDVITHFDVHGHGNSTWKNNEKRPYNIKFTDDAEYDSGREIGVLGMSASSKWCLLADVWDRTLVRNRLAHYLGAQVEMDYAIETRYVHLYLGSEYKGSYLMTEKAAHVEDELGLELATGDNMNGSWILEFDNASGQPNQFLVKNIKVTVKSPIENCNYTALKKHLTQIHVALNDPNGYNANTGKYYYDYMDLESYAKYILIREFTMDYDTVVDHWAYYDARDGLLHAGPLWDFDNSMGNSSKPLYKQTDSLLVLEDTKGPGCWLMKLMEFEKFREILKEQYEKYSYLFDINDSRSAYAVFESWFEEVKPIAELNDYRWGFITNSKKPTSFAQDDSRFAIDYSYVAEFLYERCKAYGKLILGL